MYIRIIIDLVISFFKNDLNKNKVPDSQFAFDLKNILDQELLTL